MSSFTGNFDDFLPETFVLPEDPEQLRIKLYQYLNQIGTSVNSKDSGLYDSIETLTGKKFLPTFSNTTNTNATYRDVYRVVVNIGQLPNSSTKTVAHGITVDQNFSLVSMYGGATAPTATSISRALPLPYMNVITPGDDVEIFMDATNVNVTTNSGSFVTYTRSFVVIEYIKVI